MIEIIVLKFNNPEVEIPCVDSVILHTTGQYHLTVHDNYPINENIGVIWNKLIGRSQADYICLLNSDTLVEDGWLEKLVVALKEDPLAGVIGPCTNSCKTEQARQEKTDRKEVVDFGALYPGWCLGGFCIVFPKKIWEEVGGFDEDFGFYGQEVNLIDKIVAKGYKQLWRKDVFVWHKGGATIKLVARPEDIEADRKLARETFLEKRKSLKKLSV